MIGTTEDGYYRTAYLYDALGRVTSATTQDGATTTTSYSGSQSTVSDPKNASRVMQTDGLGRLTSVADATGTASYAYDLLDNVTSVTQGAQTRTFNYDSLKRLGSATNPENGTITYNYDAVGNLTSKTDNRGITTSYYYDALNRIAARSYSDGTPTVNFGYDNAGAYAMGKLSQVTNGSSTTNYTAFDALGNTTASNQQTARQTYGFSYSYNLAGSLTSETYPSGRVVSTTYDQANRATSVGAATPYVTKATYAPHGAPWGVFYANNVVGVYTYNAELQPNTTNVTIGQNSNQTLLKLTYSWGTQTDNGDLMALEEDMGSGAAGAPLTSFLQNFAYDGANRLSGATDSGGWSRNWDYDRYGNNWVSQNSGTGLGLATPQGPVFNASNQNANESYDAAGNQLTVGGTSTTPYVLHYDAENRVSSETNGGGGGTNYLYDGDGRRVEKKAGSWTTVYVYDALGQKAAEYSNQTTSSPCTTCYFSYDHLGTARLITDQNGKVVSRHDYLPFGEEIQGNTASRTSQWGPAADSINQKFTGQERDSETGLDYFGARYFGGAMGRFTSPDEPLADQNPSDPQSWNLYAYVRNNPIVNADPSGEDCITLAAPQGERGGIWVTTVRGGSSDTCGGGIFVDGTVNTKSYSYHNHALTWSDNSVDRGGAIDIVSSPLASQDEDNISPFGAAIVRSLGARTNASYQMMGVFAGGSVLGGGSVAGGLALTGGNAALTTLGLRGAALLPILPSAFDKLQKIGLSLQQATELVESPAAQKLVDNAHGGNINVLQNVGDKVVRITLDPSGSRIISAGYMQSRNVANGIASGRFTPMQ